MRLFPRVLNGGHERRNKTPFGSPLKRLARELLWALDRRDVEPVSARVDHHEDETVSHRLSRQKSMPVQQLASWLACRERLWKVRRVVKK